MRGLIVSAFAITGVLAAVALTGCDSSFDLTGPSGVAASVRPSAAASMSLPLDGRSAAQLRIVAGFTSVTVTSGSIGSDLIRLSSPAGSPAVPSALINGDLVTVGRRAVPGSGTAADALQVVVSDRVSWQLNLAGGASNVTIALTSHSGTTPVTVTAGVSDLHLQAPAIEPVRLTVGAGAGSATIDGVAHTGIAAGTIVTDPSWPTAADRIDLDCVAGIGSIEITHA